MGCLLECYPISVVYTILQLNMLSFVWTLCFKLLNRVFSMFLSSQPQTVMEKEHAEHMQRLIHMLDAERERSAELVNSAVDGVQAAYGEIYPDVSFSFGVFPYAPKYVFRFWE